MLVLLVPGVGMGGSPVDAAAGSVGLVGAGLCGMNPLLLRGDVGVKNLGDFTAGKTVICRFNTHAADGTPTTLSGTPAVSVYKNSTTESTTGVSLTVDYDSRTGLNSVSIDTSADGTFYAGSNDFDIVITTGTVGGISVVGTVVGTFSLANRSALRPATADRTLVVDAAGLADATTVKLGPSGSATAQAARDIGTSVLLSSGTGTGQLDFTSGVVKSNVTQWLGTTVDTPTTAGVPNVNAKTWNDLATVALPLVPTTAGRTLDVSAGGEAGVDWANVGSPTTPLALTGTTIATTQKVDIETIKTNPVVNAGTVTFPTTATLASTTNITAGTITTTTNLTNLPAITTNWLTANGLASDAVAEIQSGLATAAALATVDDFLDTEIAAIIATLGAAGAGLTAIPWNAAWDTEVQSECADALAAYGASTVTTAQVNAEVVDALATDTYGEPTGAPAATASIKDKIGRLYQALRNKATQTSSAKTFFDDAGASLWSKAISDDTVTYTEAEGA